MSEILLTKRISPDVRELIVGDLGVWAPAGLWKADPPSPGDEG